MINKSIWTVFLIAAGAICILGQIDTFKPGVRSEPNITAGAFIADGGSEDLEQILGEAARQTENYREAFKNLLATETKTFEDYGKNDEIKNQTVVESKFLVYQSSKDAKITSELRSIIKVDGKLVPDSEERSNRLFAELQKASTLKSELEKIQKEGNRYDKTLEIDGLTLYEAVPLSANLRPYFDFKLVSTESYEGNDVYVVSYLQTKASPYISLNGKRTNENSSPNYNLSLDFNFGLPGSLKKADAFLNGKLWIDAKTFQIRREERFLTVQTNDPVVVLETVFEYQPSNYEILVPKRISLTMNEVKNKDNKNIVSKDMRVNFDYSEFKKYETDVKIIDDTTDK